MSDASTPRSLQGRFPFEGAGFGARAGTHVALRLVEDFLEGADSGLAVSAPKGASATVVIDLGLVEF